MTTVKCRFREALIASVLSFLVAGSALAQQESDPDAGVPRLTQSVPDGGSPTPEEVSAEDLAGFADALAEDAAAAAPAPAQDPQPVTAPWVEALHGLDLALITDVAAAYFSAEEPLQTGGHDPAATGFTLQQVELSIASVIDPYFRFDGNIVFSQFGVEIEEAYATTLALPERLQVRAGQFLTRFGRQNGTHPHTWSFVDQPFALGRVFGGENNRGLGAELSWLTPLPWFVEVLGSVTDARGQATARSFFGASTARVLDPLDLQLTGAVKQFFDPSDDLSLLLGLSAATGPNPTGHRTRTDVYGVDLYVKYRPVSFQSATQLAWQTELLLRRRQVPEDLLQDWNGYTQLLWRFDQRWETGVRHELGTAALGRDGKVAADPLDPLWTESRQRTSLVLTFFPTEFSRLRLQTAADLPAWRDRPDFSAFLALEVVAGAHGAHAF